jgi:hypothetical protein
VWNAKTKDLDNLVIKIPNEIGAALREATFLRVTKNLPNTAKLLDCYTTEDGKQALVLQKIEVEGGFVRTHKQKLIIS